MATGVDKAADRFQNLHNLHLLICVVVVVFGIVDVLDGNRRNGWIRTETEAIGPLLRDARNATASLRELLYKSYGLPKSNRYSASESARVEALLADIYLTHDFVDRVRKRIRDTVSSAPQRIRTRAGLQEIAEHLEDVRIVLAYGTAGELAQKEVLFRADLRLGSIGESKSLPELAIVDLARLGYAASIAPLTAVEGLASVAARTGPLSGAELGALNRWVQKSRPLVTSFLHVRANAGRLWESWLKFTTPERMPRVPTRVLGLDVEKIATLLFTPHVGEEKVSSQVFDEKLDKVRNLKIAISTTQNLEEFLRSLQAEDLPFGRKSVKVPGLDVDLTFRYLVVVFPWVVAFLLAFKYATVHQIRFRVLRVPRTQPDTLTEMRLEVAGTLPLYRWMGLVGSRAVFCFVVLSEILSIAVIPISAVWLRAGVEGFEGWIFSSGCFAALALWLLYIVELWHTRRALFADN